MSSCAELNYINFLADNTNITDIFCVIRVVSE
jgi:hypothetical protein